jgi:DNA-binding transcriptional regulator YhcF (GntR family)
MVHEATGMSRSAITQGIAEMAHPQDAVPSDRTRMAGSIGEKHPHYERELESLLDASVIGDREKTLRHVSKSTHKLSDALKAKGIEANHETVRKTLKRLGYKMQGNQKVKSTGADHRDRDRQFQHIKRVTKRAIKSKNPGNVLDLLL